jgi:hypothetical protein
MSNHNHTGSIWSNATTGVRRHTKPHTDAEVKDVLPADQPLLIFCYSHGDTVKFENPNGHTNMSNAWDFVVTNDDDSGGFVADVYINTGNDIIQQLGPQGTSDALRQRLALASEPPLG